MEKKVRHLLGISGGKDSAALAIYMSQKYPQLDIEYYTCDTGKELAETYALIDALELFLGKKIKRLVGAEYSTKTPFDHFLELNGNFLPSQQMRWCTRKLKLDPFEKFVGDDLVISYVGIRGDEDRDGYISTKTNIQSVFPFRKNIWSEDVIAKVLANSNIDALVAWYNEINPKKINRIIGTAKTPISAGFTRDQKLKALLDLGVKEFNHVVFNCLKSMDYPLTYQETFPLVDNEDILIKKDIFQLLEDSGVGVPEYYKEIDYVVDGNIGQYSRTRSGCFFCFYQQKIEWVWLYEQHPDKFAEAMEYEKEGYYWMQGESLAELIRPERIEQIKAEHLKRVEKTKKNKKSANLVDILDDEEEDKGCASCFV